MGLNFSDFLDSGKNELNTTGQQFAQTGAAAFNTTFTSTATTVETAYTVPTGKKLYITKLFLYNGSGSSQSWNLRKGTVTYWINTIAASSTDEIDFNTAMVFVAGETLRIITNNIGSSFTMIGWEQ